MNLNNAKNLINQLDLSTYTRNAVVRGTLRGSDAKKAEDEYRHHLLLMFISIKIESDELVVPTHIADMIWHEHIEDRSAYKAFCVTLYGKEIRHDQTLTKGTPRYDRALAHTKTLDRSTNDDGFISGVYAVCGGTPFTPNVSSPGTAVLGNNHHDTPDTDATHSTHCVDTDPTDTGGDASGGCGGGGCGAD